MKRFLILLLTLTGCTSPERINLTLNVPLNVNMEQQDECGRDAAGHGWPFTSKPLTRPRSLR